MFQKIARVSFCEKEFIKKEVAENSFFLSDNEYTCLCIVEGSFIKTYNLVLEKRLLTSMLTPGAGQAYFDDMILEFKKGILLNQ